MPKSDLGDLLTYLHRICAKRHAQELSDSQLLERFLTHREDAAFSVLVHRHGRMVFGVCRRTTGDVHLAEDAFQATFLVLAQRANSIRKKGFVAGWLYAIAHRIALRARAENSIRQRRERRVLDMPRLEPHDELTCQELRVLLDEEISRLPEKCRAPIVLCYIEGKSHEQAALELGWPRTSLTSRLTRARKLLRRQLTGRGIVVSNAALSAALLDKTANAAVGAMLTINTVKAAASVIAGKTLAAACLSVRAIALAEEAMKATFGIKKLIVVFMTMSLAVGGASLAGHRGISDQAPSKLANPDSFKSANTLSNPEAFNSIINLATQKNSVPGKVDSYGDALPEGAIARLGTLRFKHDPEKHAVITDAAYSPDGKLVATLAFEPNGSLRLWDTASGRELPGPWNSSDCCAVTFSPDNKVLAAVTNNVGDYWGGITLWAIGEQKVLRAIKGNGRHLYAITFAADGKKFIAAGEGSVRWFDAATGGEERNWEPFADETQSGKIQGDGKQGPPRYKTFDNSTFSSDARYLAVRSRWYESFPHAVPSERGKGLPLNRPNGLAETEVVVFDLTKAKEPWRTKRQADGIALSVGFSADSKRIAIAVGPGKVEIRDTHTGKLIASPPLNPNAPNPYRVDWIGAVALTPDGNTVAVAGRDSHLTLWSPSNPTLLRKVVGRMALLSTVSTQALKFSPDGKALMAGADSDIQIYDTATQKEINPWDGHRAEVHHVAFSADGKQLLTGSAQVNYYSKEVIRWDTTTWKAMHMTSHRTPQLPNIGVSSPEHTYYTGREGDQRLSMFDMINGGQWGRMQVPEKQDPTARGFFSPGSKFYVLAGINDMKIPVERLFAVPSGKFLCELPLFLEYREAMRPIAFSPNNELVALFAVGDGRIYVIDTGIGRVRYRLGQEWGPTADFAANLTFSADSKLLASWNKMDNTVRVWDMKSGKQRFTLPDAAMNNRAYFAFSPNGHMLAVADKKIQVWELATLKVRREFTGHREAVLGLAYSPDSKLLASCGVDSTVLIWDMWGLNGIGNRPESK